MTVEIQLLGTPRLRVDGEPRALRGRKAWSLLTHLLLADRPASREQLAELLFPEAADPLGALRWNLAELRRGLGPDSIAAGREPAVTLPLDTVVDVRVLRDGTPAEAAALPGLGAELLEGVEAASPAF
ncbi:MAG TPA: hypothetical protein VF587_08485, partial [Solirubrobacteraceae bacterium]